MADVRLQRYLAQSGVASRRKAEQLIVDGRVAVNGRTVTELGTKVDERTARVTVDGRAVYPEDRRYILFNKPKGCITAVSDPEGRATVMEYLPGLPSSVVPVGRLDYYSEGVLLLTNDGELAAALLAPQSKVEKTYHVKIRGKLSPQDAQRLRDGVRLDDGRMSRPAQIDWLPHKTKHNWLGVTISEGRNRQVRRMFEAVGHQVLKLQRVAFAELTFHGLRVGDARELTASEVNTLRKQVGLKGSNESRGTWSVKREDTEYARRALHRRRVEAAEQQSAAAARGPAQATGTPPRGERGPGRQPAARGPARPSSTRRGRGRPTGSERRSGERSGGPRRGPGRGTRGAARSGAGRSGGGRSSSGRGGRGAAPGKSRASSGRRGGRGPKR